MTVQLTPGTAFAGYSIEGLVGRGGMAIVYRATDLSLERPVALKLITPDLAQDDSFRERFLRESRLAASLDHPNVVPIYEAGQERGTLYLAMRYVEGRDLRALLEREGKLSPERALRVLSQVASALDAAHARGLVHRDVKPANILLDEQEHVYLTDFGLTKQLAHDASATPTGQMVGTLDYIAPEQIRGAEVDGRTDLYALGCCLYQCLQGKPPFRRENEAGTLWAHMQEEPPAIPAYPALGQVLRKALAKEREDRYATCGELVAATAEALGFEVPTAARRPFAPRVRAPELRRREAERKIVTVLFVDLVGFTRQVEGLDPEDVSDILGPYYRRVREELERFGGSVEKFIGDAVMALFGAPVAHEDDPERALRAALAICEFAAEEKLQLRVGIATGEVLVTLGARADKGQGMAAGDVVNTASRLETAAPVNGILVDEKTFEATRYVIEYSEPRSVSLKGKSRPVTAWQALAARAPIASDRAHGARLVGRRQERALLEGALARAQAERSSQLVTLVGVPGIGKSRLVVELFRATEAGADPVSWLRGRCLPYGEGVTFWALGEMVKAQAGILETDSAEKAVEKLRAVAEVVEATEHEWVARHLATLVGVGADGPVGVRLRAEAFAAWRRFFEALAEARTLVLVFEDLHWGDENLLDFVDHLVEWASDVPLLVLCTARPQLLDRRPGWGGGKPNATTLSLAPLSEPETTALLDELLGDRERSPEFEAALLARVGGNPLYAEQYARMLQESGDRDELPLPESVHGIIAARLDLLPPEEKALLQDAAVVGNAFWTGSLSSLADVERGAVDERLRTLERKEFVRRRRSSVADESEYAFRHILVRDVAYAQIPRAERAHKHRLAAEWIESLGRPEGSAEMLAHHYVNALDFARASQQETANLAERARVALQTAGDHAAMLNAFDAAARFYADGLALWPDGDPEQSRLRFRLGVARFRAEGAGAAELDQAREELLGAGDRETAGEADVFLAELRFRQGDVEGAFARLEHAAALLHGEPASRSKAYVLSSLSRFRAAQEESEEAIRLGREALAMAEQLGLDEIRAHALNNIGLARVTLGDRGGLADLEQSLEISVGLGSLESVRAYLNLGTMLNHLGDLDRSFAVHAEGRRAAERLGDATGIRWFVVERLFEDYFRGRWDDAVAGADGLLDEVEGPADFYTELGARHVRGSIRLARGDLDGAQHDVTRYVELGREVRYPQALLPALALALRVLAAAGRDTEAAEHADELLAAWRESKVETAGYWTADLAFGLVSLGRGDELVDLAGSVVAPTPWLDAAVAYASGDVSAAADRYAKIGSLPDEAFARLRSRATAGADAFVRRVGAVGYGEAAISARHRPGRHRASS